jgi:molybdate transport system substrate-binding protein
MKRLVIAYLVVAAVVVRGATTHAEEIRVLASAGIKAVVEDLAPKFEATTKHKVISVFDLASTLKTKIDGGEPFDVAILTPQLLDDLIGKGAVTAPSRSVVARAGLGLMIRAGAPKPDLSTVEAFKRTLLAAKSVTYATAGASGIAFLATIEKLGVADAVKAKARPAASGDEVNANVLKGVADFGVLPISEILPVRGAQLAGPFPNDVQTYVVMTAGVGARAAQAGAAREFIAFLMSPGNTPTIVEKGMER